MKKTTALLIFLSLVANFSSALEDTFENRKQEAKRYLMAQPFVEGIRCALEIYSSNQPPEERSDVTELIEHIDIAALETAALEILSKHFTADELKALADFYGSAPGKSGTFKLTAFTLEMKPIIQSEMEKAITLAQNERELAEAQNMHEITFSGEEEEFDALKINPDEHIFDVEYGSSEDQVIAKYGTPDGILRVDANTSVMIYGKRFGFIFQFKELIGINIAWHSLLDSQLAVGGRLKCTTPGRFKMHHLEE
jgi:hypothetical protein